jgi:hypothetical protein
MKWAPNEGKKIIFCRSESLSKLISTKTKGQWKSARDVLGKNYSYDDLSKAQGILVIPYNISTMSLFEFATAGIEILVPSKRFLQILFESYDGVLSELSFFQILEKDVQNLPTDDPNNYRSDKFYEWWVSRSDFYNASLMPNVKFIDSFEELNTHAPADPTLLRSQARIRNNHLRLQRQELLSQFMNLL